MELFGKDNIFDTPKPEGLIQRIIHIGDRQIFIWIDRLFFFDFGFRHTFSIGAGLMTVF